MRFYFDIDEAEFAEEYGKSFQESVHDGVVRVLAEETYYNFKTNILSEKVEEILQSRQQEIVNEVIERVAEKITRKKAIAAMTPKASELAAADKDNIAYFEQMIDKAIAKKFGR